MKIITILLLMVSTQILAEERLSVADGDGDITERLTCTVKQCNQIANISKRTIKAAISGVPIAEVINKFGMSSPVGGKFVDTQQADEYQDTGAGKAIEELESSGSSGQVRLMEYQTTTPGHKIRAIYKTVNQIKTKYGQVRPQDRVRLNNRVEQKLLECRDMANNLYGTPSSEISVEGVVALPYPRCLQNNKH